MNAVTWQCPKCRRSFRQVNQRHSCGVGDRAALLRNKPEPLVTLYIALERTLRSYSGVEIVTRDRYALFRTTRIFSDMTFQRDALRLVVHLGRAVSDPLFSKVVHGDNGRIAHVAKLRDAADLEAVKQYLKEAHELARR